MPQGQGQQAARAGERGEREKEKERQWKSGERERERKSMYRGRRGRQGNVVGGSGSADYSSIFLIWNYTSIDWGVNGLRLWKLLHLVLLNTNYIQIIHCRNAYKMIYIKEKY